MTGLNGGDKGSEAEPQKILDGGRMPCRKELSSFPNQYAFRGGAKNGNMRSTRWSRLEKRKTTFGPAKASFDLELLTAEGESEMCLGDEKLIHRKYRETSGIFITPTRLSPEGLSDQSFMPTMQLVASDLEAPERDLDMAEDAV